MLQSNRGYLIMMLFQITKDTSIEELIISGASVDGKITQQAVFIKKGLSVPITFFFTSAIAHIENGEIKISSDLHKKVLQSFGEYPYEYQIRTESINETDRVTDIFAETRIGLNKNNLEENLIGLLTEDKKIRDVTGLIQILPPQSIDRNLIAGLAQIINENGQPHLYVSLHRGLASYVARVGTCDAILDIPLNELEFEDLNISKYINFKSKKEIFENISLNLIRFGITALSKEFKTIGISSPVELPFNNDKGRLKKEYEFTDAELKSATYSKSINNLSELIEIILKDPVVDFIKKELNLNIFPEMDLSTLLISFGAYYLSIDGDKLNSIKNEIIDLEKGNSINSLINNEVLQIIINEIPRLGADILTSHLCSFSVVLNELNLKPNLILWDMPLDKELSLTQNNTVPENLYWILSSEQDLSDLNFNIQDIGIDLKTWDNINSDLLKVLKALKENKNIKNIYTRYSLLSHLATIIREHNYNVISIL